MKKNKVLKISLLVLLLILIIVIIFVLSTKSKDMTALMYDRICNEKNYTFSMKEEDSDINYSLTISKKDNYMSIDVNAEDEHTTTLIKDDIAYYIMHNEQEYYLYDSAQIDADILKNDLSGIKDKGHSYGHEEINGKEYYYEEYEDITAFIMWSDYDEDESTIKTRFYFDGKNIAYIKTIIEDEEELLKVEFSDNINENLFEIPNNYAEL